MAELSVRISEDAITIVSDMPITLPKRWLHPELVKAFCKANYSMQGTVSYQSWLAGVFAGLALVIGPDGVPFSCAEEVKEPVLDVIAAGTLNIRMANEELGGLMPPRSVELLPGEIVVPGQTVIDGETVHSIESVAVLAADDDLALFVDAHPHKIAPGGEFSPEPAVSETIVPSSETPAAVGESVPQVSESIPAVSESPAAVANPEASGATSP